MKMAKKFFIRVNNVSKTANYWKNINQAGIID